MTVHPCNRTRDCKPETEAKYRPAFELYTATDLSIAGHSPALLLVFVQTFDNFDAQCVFYLTYSFQ